MCEMRTAAFFFAVVLLAIPFSGSAQGSNPPALVPDICKNQLKTTELKTQKTFIVGKSSADEIRNYIRAIMACPNACFYEGTVVVKGVKVGEDYNMVIQTHI